MSTTEIMTEPSICIPRTLNNVSWRDVKDTFEKLLGKGAVERVDIVSRRDEESPFCRIFVHMRYWAVNDETVAGWRQTLIDGGEIKVVHNHPWFWKCVASRVAKPVKTNISSAPYIMKDTPAPKATDHTVADHLPDSIARAVAPAVSRVQSQDNEDANEYSGARMQAADEGICARSVTPLLIKRYAPNGGSKPFCPG